MARGQETEEDERMKHNPHLGDIDDFVRDNMGLVIDVASKYRRAVYSINHIAMEDLHSVGSLGLAKAYERFNPDSSKDGDYAPYACRTINGEILRFLRDYSTHMKFSRAQKELYTKINKYNVSGTIEEIAEQLDVTVEAVEDAFLFARLAKLESLDVEIFDEGSKDKKTYADIMPAPIDTENEILYDMYLHEIKNSLNDLEYSILTLTMEGYTQVEIGKKLGFSQMHISRNLKKARLKTLPIIGESKIIS